MNKLLLNLSIYSLQNIQQTMLVFKGYAEIKMELNEYYATLVFLNPKYDVELTIHEFENYLICMENS